VSTDEQSLPASGLYDPSLLSCVLLYIFSSWPSERLNLTAN